MHASGCAACAKAEAPFVGTGMEEPIVARDTGAAIGAKRGGIVDQVDATRIVVRATGRSGPWANPALISTRCRNSSVQTKHLYQPASAGRKLATF